MSQVAPTAPEAKQLRIGWIGCGNHATDNLLPYLRHTRSKLVATCDMNLERAAQTAEQYGAEASYDDYHQLLQRGDLDAVMMAVGPQQHYEMTLAALEKGLHVFAEKPPSATAEQAQELAVKARDAGVQLMAGFMKRFATVNLMARQIINSAEFGRPLSLVAQYMTAPSYFSDSMGFLHHHCVHYADLVQYMLGPVEQVQARRLTLTPTQLLYQINLEFSSGALGFLQMGSMQSRGNPVESLQVMSEGHRVEVHNVNRVTYYRPNEQKWPLQHAQLNNETDALTWEPNFTAAINQDHKGYANELMHFVDAVLDGGTAQPGPTESASAMKLLEAIAHSAEIGKVVSVN